MIFFMEQNISIQEHFKIILYLYQLSESIGGNLMDCKKKVMKILLDPTTFLLQLLLLIIGLNFNRNCVINNIFIPKKVTNLYMSYILNAWLRKLTQLFN